MESPTDRQPPPPRQAVAPPELTTSAPAAPEPASRDARVTARAWVVVTAVVAGLALVALLVAVFTSGSDEPTERRDTRPRTLSGPLNNRQEARLELVTGAETVTVRSADLGEELYRVQTAADGSLVPQVNDDGANVRVSLDETGGPGPATVEIQLNGKVRWQLTLAGGGTRVAVDLGTGQLAGIELTGGAAAIELTVPQPQGAVLVRLASGAGQLVVHVPNGPPVQVRLASGAGTVTVDGQVRTGVAGGTAVTPPGWAQAADKYDIEAVGGIGAVTVDRR